ncbi:hypothetical protein PDE_02719 [Penicillium oxalicum 114-2]|uniref:Uncharacterized protein n=1 Tax=Penicillium oxalicum (strain 114-2 / CGMCC 5302) TaxID=933388 RepID=S7ZAZ5_PENO1|nr:hypothetical protein PDE_02719 [Penicillium oxalicum 114-2]
MGFRRVRVRSWIDQDGGGGSNRYSDQGGAEEGERERESQKAMRACSLKERGTSTALERGRTRKKEIGKNPQTSHFWTSAGDSFCAELRRERQGVRSHTTTSSIRQVREMDVEEWILHFAASHTDTKDTWLYKLHPTGRESGSPLWRCKGHAASSERWIQIQT